MKEDIELYKNEGIITQKILDKLDDIKLINDINKTSGNVIEYEPYEIMVFYRPKNIVLENGNIYNVMSDNGHTIVKMLNKSPITGCPIFKVGIIEESLRLVDIFNKETIICSQENEYIFDIIEGEANICKIENHIFN